MDETEQYEIELVSQTHQAKNGWGYLCISRWYYRKKVFCRKKMMASIFLPSILRLMRIYEIELVSVFSPVVGETLPRLEKFIR